jgi:thiopeptide-type bacteriocin biosynthesis protein
MKKQLFYPFDEWMYFKIYCNPKIVDKIIIELYSSFLKDLIEKKIIDKFFYIRYFDTAHHLRLRIQISKGDVSYIFDQLKAKLAPHLDQNIIYNIELSSYRREIKRYGEQNIEDIECLFFHDSKFVLNGLSNIGTDELGIYRWLMALVAIDQYLDDFNLNLDQKIVASNHMFESWSNALLISKDTKIDIDRKYRSGRASIEKIFNKTFDDPIIEKIMNLSLLRHKSIKNNINSILNEQLNTEEDINEVMYSLIHMIMNKIFVTEPNRHELIIYSFAYKHYKSAYAQQKIYNDVV